MNFLNYLTVPNTGMKITDGSVVTLNRFPNVKWIVHNGWYAYNGQQFMGWYFCSIPAQTIIPVNDTDLALLTVVNAGSTCPPAPCPMPNPSTRPDHSHTHDHCHPPAPPVPPHIIDAVDRAFLTVDTIAQRNELNKRTLLPHGKIVRVNNAGGFVKYYEWDQAQEQWSEVSFGGSVDVDLSKYLTSDEGDTRYAQANHTHENTDNKIEDLSKQLDAIKSAAEWGDIG